MELINTKYEDGILTIGLKGHIDSANAAQVEKEITEAWGQYPGSSIIVDCSDLEYISSAGLRVILRLRKQDSELKVTNVSSEVYEIFDMTGFTEMMEITKAYRKISVEGCEVVGESANGKVYRIDPDTIVKVYRNPDSLPDIKRERELARTALILGIPTAIPYDVVKVGEGYGSVFELLNATSFAKIIAQDNSRIDEIVELAVDLLKKIHGTVVKEGAMPQMKSVAVKWVTFLKDYLPQAEYEKFLRMTEEVPEVPNMLHGDYHLKNVMLQNGEVLLIDMDTLCTGHPVFEFASIFNAYQGFSELNHQIIQDFQGISYETGGEIWQKILHLYFAGKSEEEIQKIADKAKLIGYARIMRRSIRRGGLDSAEEKALIESCRRHIIDLLATTDSLVF